MAVVSIRREPIGLLLDLARLLRSVEAGDGALMTGLLIGFCTAVWHVRLKGYVGPTPGPYGPYGAGYQHVLHSP